MGFRLLWVGVLVTGWLGVGCNGCGRPPEETSLTLEYVQPTEAQLLTVGDDVDPDTPGFQYDVKLRVGDSSGRSVTLASARLETRSAQEETWTPGPEPVIAGQDITFARVTLATGRRVLRVTAEEAGSSRTAMRSITVDVRTSLSIEFLQPTDGQVLSFQQDVDPATPELQYDVKVRAADGSGRAVTLGSAKLETRPVDSETWSPGPAAALDRGEATFPGVTLPHGRQVLRVSVEETGTRRTAIHSVTVDVQVRRPMVTGIGFEGDANNDRRLNASELPSGAPVMFVATVNLEDGQPVRVRDPVNGTVYGEGTASGNAANITLDELPLANDTEAEFPLVVEVTDRAGRTNKLSDGTPSDPVNQAAFAMLRVDRKVPVITVISPDHPNLVLADDGNTSMPDFQVRLAFSVPADVKDGGVQVIRNSGATTKPTPVSGMVVEDITVPWSPAPTTDLTFEITATDESGNVSPVRTVNVTVPRFISAARVTGGDGDFTDFAPVTRSLTFVASTNENLLPGPSHPGYVVDKVAGGDAQVDLDFTFIYSNGASAQVMYRGTGVSPTQAITTNSAQILSFPGVTLAHDTQGPLGVRVFTSSGAEALFSVNAMVDVQPPAKSTVTLSLVTTGSFTDRNPALDVGWGGSNDDGGTGAGAPVGFDVRWSTDAVLANGIDSEAVFHDTARVLRVGGGLLAPGARSTRLTNLPTIGRYYVQVRAKDEVGNYAPFSTPPHVDHMLSERAFNNPGLSSNKFGAYLYANGSLNNDGIDDLVVAETVVTQPGRVYVIYGSSALSTATVQAIEPPDTVSQFFGSSVSVGNVGDLAVGPIKADLVVGAPTWSSRGRAILYFGQNSPTLNPVDNIEFRGNASSSFANSVRVIDDIDNDGFGEILISAHGENAPLGRVYLFKGRTRESWLALRVVDSSDGALVITPAQADRVFDGPAFNCAVERPLSGCPNYGSASLLFGRRLGYASLGDVNGDGVGDFTIPQSRDYVNRMFIYSGASTTELQRLVQDDPTAFMVQQANGFGSDAFGRVNLIGTSASDLAVSYPIANRIHLFAGGSAPLPFSTTSYTIRGSGSFGFVLAHGDINGDGREDIVVGSNNSIAAGGGLGSAYVLYNTGISGAEYDLGAGNAIGPGATGFRQSRLTGAQALGIGVAVGDFNGDGRRDVAASDWLDGCTQVPPKGPEQCSANPGKVIIRY